VYLLLAKPSGLALHSGKVYHQDMNQLSRFVSLHPYFKVPPDKMPYLKAILPEFAAKTRNETGNLFYEFTINGDEVFCREGYVNAEALLAHLENVGDARAGAGDGRPDSHRSPRISRRTRETKRAAGPSETLLVRIAQLTPCLARRRNRARSIGDKNFS
jgi:quinol monooxygenase YgiN